MASNITESTSTVSTTTLFPYINSLHANHIKFGVLVVLQAVSIPCFLYVFFQFYRQRQLRQSLSCHIMLLLLINSFLFVTIALPLTEVYLYRSYVSPASVTFCNFWNWFHYSLNITNIFLMAFASIEQHWLIFYPAFIRHIGKKVLFHFCPIAFCLLYPTMFYFILILVHSCRVSYNFDLLLCKWPCFYRSKFFTQFDLYFNNYTPLIVIPVFCAILYVRVFIKKRSLKLEAFKWKRDKKMIIKLWAISSLYLGMWMPLQLLGIINLYFDTYFLYQAQVDYMFLFPYLIHIVYPFIVLLTHHNEMFHFQRNRLHPQRIIPRK